MKGVSWRPGGLSWRLTLSYILVTLVAAFTILLVIVLASTIQDLQQSNVSPDLALAKGAQVHPGIYLDQPTPNEEALRYWVAIPLFDALSQEQIPTSLVAVLDLSGQPVSATACNTASLLADGTQRCLTMSTNMVKRIMSQRAVRALVVSTLTEKGKVTVKTQSLLSGETVFVQSVMGERKQVVGAVLAVIHDSIPSVEEQAGSPVMDFLTAMWNHVPSEGLFFILLAIAAGTVTGLLVSRNLARRLRHIMQAAVSWSQGEFQTTLNDPSPDEVGQLARNLNTMAEQLQQVLVSWQKLAVMEERNRLARELHDSVKQHVFTNELLVRAARKMLLRDPQKAQQHLLEAEELGEQTQQELIELIQALRPAALAEKGLAPVIQDYLVTWSRRTGIAFKVTIQQERLLHPERDAALFRVFQEALTNVARHSMARRVSVELVNNDEALTLTIQDDGKGFDLSQANGKGLGLTSMRERVEMLGGRLTIMSSSQGTQVQAWLPNAQYDEKQRHEVREVRNA